MLREQYKNIIFDLGGVIINLDTQLTYRAFERLFFAKYKSLQKALNKHNLLEKYELGSVTTDEFLSFFKQFHPSVTPKEIKKCWNSMLLDIPFERVNLIQELSKKYNVFLLSNTNEIHTQFINEYMQHYFNIESITGIFKKGYLSYELNLRKPDKRIFELILSENKLLPNETLFIDDTEEHIHTANQLGINTHHLVNATILDFF